MLMPFNLKGHPMNRNPNTVVITGASRGIGAALVKVYVQKGAKVIAVSRSTSETAAPDVTPVAADLSTETGIERVMRAVAALGRPVDVLINNAGIQNALDLRCDVDPARIDTEMAINLTAPVKLTLALMPFLRRPGATVVNVTSLVSLHPKPSAPVYSASKAGLASFTRALRHQMVDQGITVIEAVPPLVETDMTRGRGTAKLSPEEMAAAIETGVERGACRIAPEKSKFVLRLNRALPSLVARVLSKE
ncbi:SDR family NAD(P)-dependent oxidoreductase [Phaeobacter sp. CAU 1743]|uniref:SDR family NAD(P)-dependent oxidoreductase n=1 Tax=Phaeobacter sp. CAU 1743 TaxID=3140367 RepID=UPI00325C2EE7